jgi:hypothetical protein
MTGNVAQVFLFVARRSWMMPRPSLSSYLAYRLGRTPRQQLARW